MNRSFIRSVVRVGAGSLVLSFIVGTRSCEKPRHLSLSLSLFPLWWRSKHSQVAEADSRDGSGKEVEAIPAGQGRNVPCEHEVPEHRIGANQS